MSISKVIGNNIKELMEKENISLRKLSEVVGVTHPTLKKYIDGIQPIDSEKLLIISMYFKKSFDYFFSEKHVDMNFLFRADKAKRDIQNIDIRFLKDSFTSYLDVMGESSYQYIPQKYTINQSLNKRDISNYISKIAQHHRRIASIEHVIPENYFEIINNIGINVIVKDFKNDNYFGASSLLDQKGSYIIVNDSDNISEERKIFSLIHEYAHLLFHSEQYTGNEYDAFYLTNQSDIVEKIANEFAGKFLLPKNLVDEYLDSRNRFDLVEMKHHFKVSMQTLYKVLYDYKYISKEESNKFWKRINAKGLKEVEEFPLEKISVEEKNSKLVKRIKELYFNDEISANKVSEVLGMNILETRKLLKEWRDLDDRYLPL